MRAGTCRSCKRLRENVISVSLGGHEPCEGHTGMTWLSWARQNERLFLVRDVVWQPVVQGVYVGHVALDGGEEKTGGGLQNILSKALM